MENPVEVVDLHVSYGKGSQRVSAVSGVSFTIEPGECVGFIGANGAGKSTTIKALMGFLYPDRGDARLFGFPAGHPEGRRTVGYLPEVALYYPFMRAAELLTLYGSLSGMPRARLRTRIPEVLQQVGLDGRGGELLRTFSKGMQQRLGIAQALIAAPELLVLDEVSAGLDPLGRHDLRELLKDLKDQGRTIFSSHELTEVESLCHRVLLIDHGRLIRQVSQDELRRIGREQSLESFFIDAVRGEHQIP
jgi:ABC-2 type transport system ATP-binding protein